MKWKGGMGRKLTIVSTGPMTNIALFVSVYPELVECIGRSLVLYGACLSADMIWLL